MTIEELQGQLDQANANVELLSNELSNQAEQFARWRVAISDIVAACNDTSVPSAYRLQVSLGRANEICGV